MFSIKLVGVREMHILPNLIEVDVGNETRGQTYATSPLYSFYELRADMHKM